MPKQVDHEQRRTEIVDALFRLAARDGLAAVSIRSVAAEAGVRPAQVQYYFGTKGALLSAALELLGTRIFERGMALIAAAGEDPTPEDLLRAALAGSHPTDDETRLNLVLFFSFLTAALTESSIADTPLLTAQGLIIESFASLLRQSQQLGRTPDSIDAHHEARLILFANTGLILGALVGIHSVDEAVAALEHHLRRVFPPTTVPPSGSPGVAG